MKFHFVNVVWGDSYTDLFLNFSLPTQLSPKNLPSFPYNNESNYKIYTTSKDAETIKRSPIYSALTAVMHTDILRIEGIDLKDKYRAMSDCHRHAIKAADREDCAICFLSPDTIWADGTFETLAKLMAAGKRAVMIAGIRLLKETFVPVLMKEHDSKDGLALSISPRKLLKIALDHLHPITTSLFWNATQFNRWPSHLYWNVGKEGMLARCFHLHPFMINPHRRGASFSSSIDGDYIITAFPNPSDLYVVEDSDEIVAFEISSAFQVMDNTTSKFSRAIQVAHWAKYNANPYHRLFIKHRIRLHVEDISTKWQEVERYSDKIISSTFQLLKFMDRIPYNSFFLRGVKSFFAACGR